MKFEKFLPPRKRADKPIVSVTRNRLQLNKKCQEYFKGANFVELYYDRKNKIIGIKLQKKETNNSIKINRYPKRGIAVIAATHFIREYEIESILIFDADDTKSNKKGERSHQFVVDWDDMNKMVIFKLG